jgi:tetratricopeptide (TPR) repeat protein
VAPTIRTCSLAFAAVLFGAVPQAAEARLTFARSGASTFVAAKAAADGGDNRRAAILYASLAAAEPGNGAIAARALAQAILAGDMDLALRLAKARRIEELAPDARLLLLAERLKGRRVKEKDLDPWPRELSFVQPFVRAWLLAERDRTDEALRALREVPADSLLAPVLPEHQALILLRGGRLDQARPLVPLALQRAGGRERHLRILFASAMVRLGASTEGLALLQGRDPVLARAAAALGAERRAAPAVSTAAEGLSELLLAMAVALDEGERRSLPLALVQGARHAAPKHEFAAMLLAEFLGRGGRKDDAIALLRPFGDESLFSPSARDTELRLLTESGRLEEGLARASAFAVNDGSAADWARLGDVLDTMKRHGPAAEAYGKAIALAQAAGAGPERWTLHLLHGASLEQANRWPEAERSLEAAHALAPANPIVLNYLGYARLERGEQLNEAEALIARASKLAPDDASITDSLGWAQFKRGRVAEAIETLGRAAAADPAQAEIHEHLGDALYTAGRKFEARHAWNAALVTADDEVKTRVEAKLAGGLTKATAAP